MSIVTSRRTGGAWVALACATLMIDYSSAQSLTLTEAMALTRERNPQLAGFPHERDEAGEQRRARSFGPPLALEVEFENLAGTGDLTGVRGAETTLQISKVFELGGKARARAALGDAELATLDARQAAARADVMAELARRFVHVLGDQEQLRIAEKALELSTQTRDAVDARIREGAISTVFLNRAEIELARVRIDQEHGEHELARSRMALAAMWADTSPAFERARGDVFALPDIEPFEVYAARLSENPDLLTVHSEVAIATARERLARSQGVPSLTVSAGVRRLEAFDDQAFVAGFSMPFGTRQRAEPEVRAAQASAAHVQASAASQRLELHALLFGLYQEISHARTEAQVLRAEILPQAERLVATTTEGYRIGRYSLVDLKDAQRTLIEVQRDSLRAALEFHTNLIEIERLTGAGTPSLVGQVAP